MICIRSLGCLLRLIATSVTGTPAWDAIMPVIGSNRRENQRTPPPGNRISHGVQSSNTLTFSWKNPVWSGLLSWILIVSPVFAVTSNKSGFCDSAGASSGLNNWKSLSWALDVPSNMQTRSARAMMDALSCISMAVFSSKALPTQAQRQNNSRDMSAAAQCARREHMPFDPMWRPYW